MSVAGSEPRTSHHDSQEISQEISPMEVGLIGHGLRSPMN